MIMKRLILSVLAIGLVAGAATAQSSSGQSSRSTSISSTGTYKAKKGKKAKKAPSETLNNRKTYHWKNGQRATPTGHEAAPLNGSYQSLKKDTAAIKQKEEEL
jgi:Ni/Co efflux regulator RcnB